MSCAGCRPSPLAGADVSQSQAAAELARMKRSLRGWLKARLKNDAIASGKIKTKLPPDVARERILAARDWAGEERIAADLFSLLSHAYPEATLPYPSVKDDSGAAVKLAEIAIKGIPDTASGPQAQGFIPLIVGGVVLLAIMSGTSAWADVQKEKEKRACIEAGACTDYGFWIKWTAIGVVGIIVLLNKDKLTKALKFG